MWWIPSQVPSGPQRGHSRPFGQAMDSNQMAGGVLVGGQLGELYRADAFAVALA